MVIQCTFEDCKETFLKPEDRSIHVYSVHNSLIVCLNPDCKTITVPLNFNVAVKMEEHLISEDENSLEDEFSSPRVKSDIFENDLFCHQGLIIPENSLETIIKDENEESQNSMEAQGSDVSIEEFVDYLTNSRVLESGVFGDAISDNQRDHFLLQETDSDNTFEKRFPCTVEDCRAVFHTAANLTRHEKAVHSDPIKCPFTDCNSFLKPKNLKVHIRQVHEKNKPKCELCGKRFALSLIYAHRKACKRDANDKLYRCLCEGCPKAFATTKDRNSHQSRVHRSRIPCPVNECNSILRPVQIPRHIKSRHGEHFQGSCPKCNKELKHAQAVKKHFKACEFLQSLEEIRLEQEDSQ